ncbi:MAG: aminotransferase class V-fold PLP-dependent enzyme [Clostridia bacterium]|nr:aminotransferase class V-fold PLP-dependent enzyme [Clostridia bacterium]
MIYLDNAATSWPKPPGVIQAMADFSERVGANPGRAGHRLAIEAGRIVYNTREALAELFNAPDPLRIVFTANITEAINICLHGLLRPGDHVITSSMEHNSVIRPLRYLEKAGVEVSVAQCTPEGELNPEEVEKLVKANTKMVVINHASNVVGTLLPVREIGRICRRYGLLFLVDSAQTAGAYPLDMEKDFIDLLCFTGHKSLYGPMGTGGVAIGNRVAAGALRPLKQGGTGSLSEKEEQPDFLPDALEPGTLNVIGLSGLAAGLSWLREQGVAKIRGQEQELTSQLLAGLEELRGVTVYGTKDAARQTGVVSFTIRDLLPSEAGLRLDEEYGLLCRVGLHCAPLAHRTIGTFPRGTIRFGLGAFNTGEEIEEAVRAVYRLTKRL